MNKEMRFHYLQHVPFENPGSILGWAKKKGFLSFSFTWKILHQSSRA
ncbi:hypothetical protein [Desulfosporosinus sp. FKB]|nr:hypothetical protein [Desulfosporosinus sp. FKB]